MRNGTKKCIKYGLLFPSWPFWVCSPLQSLRFLELFKMSHKSGKFNTVLAKIILIPAIIIIILATIALARETYKKNQIQREIEALKEKASQIDKESSQIQEKIAYLGSTDYQEKEAKDKLNLRSPGESVVIIKPGIAKEPQIEEAPAPNIPVEDTTQNPIKWWNYFFKY